MENFSKRLIGASSTLLEQNLFTSQSPLNPSAIRMQKRMPPLSQDELYKPRKAAQLIAYFALREGGRAINKLKAIKLTYLADRESLRRWGGPILHEPRGSLPLGPVNRTTLDYVNGGGLDPTEWARIVLPCGKTNTVIEINPSIEISDLNEFSEAELEVLDNVWAQHGQRTGSELVAWTHNANNIAEWQNPDGGMLPIELIDILRVVEYPNPERAIQRIEKQRGIERSFRTVACQH